MAKRRVTRLTVKYLTEKEIDVLFQQIDSKRDRAMFRLAYHRGLRASEVGQLQMADYRREVGRLTVRRLKGSRAGEFRLTRAEETSLRAWFRERGTAPGAIFPGRGPGGGICRQQLDRLMRRYAAAAGIDPTRRHMHCLKHSCATHLLTRERDITIVQDWLGHADIKSTMVYAQITSPAREAAAERLRDWGK